MSTVAVIGCGISGLTAAKSCAEQGLKPTIFEKSDQIGGVWRLNGGNAWSNMHTNGSKFLTTYADFPWPESAPLLPSKEQVYEYLQSYKKHFDLEKYINYNSHVTHTTQLDNKKWVIKWTNTQTEKNEEEIFDYLILSIGNYSNPNIPNFEGQNKYKGQIIHSISYDKLKSSQNLKGKKIIVIGHGFSATEICAELAEQEAEVTNIFRNPHWVIPKFIKTDVNAGALINDFLFFNRKAVDMFQKLNSKTAIHTAKNGLLGQICAEQITFPDLYKNPESSDAPFISISSDYMKNVKNGKIKTIKQHIKSFDEKGVITGDGSSHYADIVLLCTGYLLKLDFMDPKILSKIEYDEKDPVQPLILFDGTFHPDVENFACVGMIRESKVAHSDIQARWASLVFSKKLKLPDKSEFDEGLKKARYLRTPEGREQVPAEFVIFPDGIASRIGVLPNFDELKMTDPETYETLWNGTLSGVEYRLNDNKAQSMAAIKEIAKRKEELLKK